MVASKQWTPTTAPPSDTPATLEPSPHRSRLPSRIGLQRRESVSARGTRDPRGVRSQPRIATRVRRFIFTGSASMLSEHPLCGRHAIRTCVLGHQRPASSRQDHARLRPRAISGRSSSRAGLVRSALCSRSSRASTVRHPTISLRGMAFSSSAWRTPRGLFLLHSHP